MESQGVKNVVHLKLSRLQGDFFAFRDILFPFDLLIGLLPDLTGLD